MEDFRFTIDHNKIIHISVYDCYSPCEAIYQLNELIPPEEVMALFPVSWEYIMECENYGCFFTMGSPQMMEEGWRVIAEYDGSWMHVTLQIPDQKRLERMANVVTDAMKYRRQLK